MMQLHDFEKSVLDGDIEAIHAFIDRAEQAEEYDFLYDAATVLIDYGFIGQADHIYEGLLKLMPNEAQLKIDRAGTLLELGEEDEALLLLTDISPDDEEYVQALMALADYYQMIGMAEAAMQKVKEALSLSPYEPIIRFAYAELLLDAGRYLEAATGYKELHDEGHNEIAGTNILHRLAETYSAGAAYEEALPYYEALLKKEVSPDAVFGAAFAYYQSGHLERAIGLLDQLAEIDPDYFSAYMLAGQVQAQLGNDQKAYEWFLSGIKRDEFDKELRLSAAKSALKLGMPNEAEMHLKESLALDPEYLEALITLASLYNEREQDEELLQLLEDVDADQFDIPLIDAFKAYALERQEQFDDAYVSYSKAYAKMTDDPSFLDRYIRFLLEEGKRQESIEVINELLKHGEHEEWTVFLEMLNDEEV